MPETETEQHRVPSGRGRSAAEDGARVVTDGLASYDSESLGERPHEAIVQTKAERGESDALQGCHWTISLLKRWLLGTHAGAVAPKHLQAYLDEFAFRDNRRKTKAWAGSRAVSSSGASCANRSPDRRHAPLPLVQISSTGLS